MLAKARDDEAAHPSVALLAAASLLAMRFVAAGKFEPGDGFWRLAPLEPADTERLHRLAASRAYDGLAVDAAETVVRRVVDAVVDTMPRSAPTGPVRRQLDAQRPPAPRGPPTTSRRRLQTSSPATAPPPTCPSW